METTFLVGRVLPPPSSRSRIFTRRNRPRARRASDAGISSIMQFVIGYIIFLDVVPDLLKTPVSQGVDLYYSSVGAVNFDLSCRCPGRDLIPSEACDPAIEFHKRSVERPD